jgi:hypothetical protein
MYTNQRRTRARVSDDSVIRDATTETRDLRVSVLRAGTSSFLIYEALCKATEWQENKMPNITHFKLLSSHAQDKAMSMMMPFMCGRTSNYGTEMHG